MASIDAATHENEHQVKTLPQPLEQAMSVVDSSNINGAAVQHNSLVSFPTPIPQKDGNIGLHVETSTIPSPTSLAPDSDSTGASTSSLKAITNVESGITPTAPFLVEAKAHPVPPAALDVPPVAESSDTSMVDGHEESFIIPSIEPSSAGPTGIIAPTENTNINNNTSSDSSSVFSDGLNPSVATNGLSTSAIFGPSQDTKMTDAIQTSNKVSRERDDDDTNEPSAKRIRTEMDVDRAMTDATPISAQPLLEDPATLSAPATTIPATNTATLLSNTPNATVPAQPIVAKNWGAMTDAQSRQLKQNLQNLKKGRYANFFSKPVDPAALNIPTYPDVIKNPMDLGTVEQKLKEGKYASVSDYIADFDLIVYNTHTFNGRQHVVSLAADNLKAQFYAGLRKVPEAGQAAPVPAPKKRTASFSLPSRDTKMRGVRQSLASNAGTAAPAETFALASNGIPTVRRASANADGRPKREIKPAPPRDLPYSAKPKKKKYQMELKFCEHVLSELKKGRYAALMVPFSSPVDPVALNIPNYHKVIKKPMDFGTVTRNLQAGEYGNLKEFESDVRLIFDNCYKFNGPTHAISGLAKQFEDIFSAEMSHKTSWINHNAPSSAHQSPEGESDTDQDNDAVEDDEEDDVNAKAEELRRIQAQIAELSAHAMALTTNSTAKPAKAALKKAVKGAKATSGKPSKKSSTAATNSKQRNPAPTTKSKPKHQRPLTNAQKEEIAMRIGELDGEQTAKAAEHIKAGLRRIGRADLADRPDEELEFDIATIPEEALQAIYKMIKSRDIPGDYRTVTSAHSKAGPPPTKTKKNKPMTKHEQEAAIRRLESQARAFDGPVKADSSSSGNDDDDDDDESGSESEEE